MKLLYLFLFLSGQAILATSPGASVLVGAPGDPSSGQRTPFGSPAVPGAPGTIYQQVYNSNNFLTPITITGLTFFATNFPLTTITDADYTIHLSTTALTVDLNNAQSFDGNLGTDNTLFFSGHLGGATGPSFTISGNGFAYNPALGNLLVDIRLSNIGTRGTGAMDARTGTAGTIFSRLQNFGQGSVSYGLVTQFETLSPPRDVSSQVRVTTSGIVYSRVTQTYFTTVNVQNISAQAIDFPGFVTVENLPPGVTVKNSTGVFNGLPMVPISSLVILVPGPAVVSTQVQFSDPSNVFIAFTTTIYSGTP